MAYRDGTPLLYGTAQPAHIADAVTDHTLSAAYDDAEVKAIVDALGAKINAIIAVLETHGLKADA